MKKGTSFFYIFTAIFSILFFSCKLEVKDTNLLTKPDIDVSTHQVTLMIPKINAQTPYINIYRQDVTSNIDTKPVVNIGILFPSAFANDTSYAFIDDLVLEGSKYKYKVRYVDSDGAYYSNWSNEITIDNTFANAYENTKKLLYVLPSNTHFAYNTSEYTLTLNNEVTLPEITNYSTNYTPMLIVNNGSKSEVYNIAANTLNIVTPATAIQAIAIRDKLSEDFLDKNIKIEGILGQRIEYKDAGNTIIKTIHWTEPTAVKISGYSSNTILIPSTRGTSGFDHTTPTN